MQKSGTGEQFDEESAKLMRGEDFFGDCDTATNTVVRMIEKRSSYNYADVIMMVTPNHYIGGIIDREIGDVWVFENTAYRYTQKAVDSDQFPAILQMPTKDKYAGGYIEPAIYRLSELQKGVVEPQLRGRMWMIPERIKRYEMEGFRTLDEGWGGAFWSRRDDLPFLKDFSVRDLAPAAGISRRYTFTKEWEAQLKLNVGYFRVEAEYDSEAPAGDRLHAKVKLGALPIGSIKATADEAPEAIPADEPASLVAGKKIALLVGHRKGAHGATNTDGITEYAYWHTWLHAVRRWLPEHHEYRIFTRRDDGYGYRARMREVGEEAAQWGAELIVSFHFNAAMNSKAEGFEVLCSKSAASRAYAKRLADCMDTHLSGDNRGVRVVEDSPEARGSGFLYKTPMPAVLVEPYFGTSEEDTRSMYGGAFFDALESFLYQI